MKIKGKVHCFFEQSGTFKNEFIKLGIQAEDYDIQNNYGETDHTDDLFKAIEDAYENKASLFDDINKDDLIIAFFPCIYFCETNHCAFSWSNYNYKKKSYKERTDLILKRNENRAYYYALAIKMIANAKNRGLRLIMENPWGGGSFLKNNFILPPSLIDRNRMARGDYYVKPTAYWFVNCEPTYGKSIQNDKEQRTIRKSKSGKRAGLCSEERSTISPDYARNFICDFILGKEQDFTEPQLFKDY